MTRYLHLTPDAVCGDRVTFAAAAAHHLGRVLRATPGDVVQAVDDAGSLLSVRLTAVAARAAEGVIVQRAPLATESSLDLTLAQGLPKADKMDVIVRMVTELGVSRVIPLLTERTVARPDPARRAARLARWQRIAKEAAQLSGRGAVPEVAAVRDLATLAREACDGGLLVCLWEEEPDGLDTQLPPPPCPRVTVVVGPEGGLTGAEVRVLREAGAVVGGLGPRLLRAETAAVTAVALLQARYGDLGAT